MNPLRFCPVLLAVGMLATAALESITAPPNAAAASIRGIVYAERLPTAGEAEFHLFDNFRFERQ